MSEINKVDSTLINIIKFYRDSKQVMGGDPCWAPPIFPDQGRLTLTGQQVKQNIKKIEYEENQNKSHLTQKDTTQCCKTLHASFFFDGTNNNNKNDTDDANPPHPTNVAKLYHASSPDIKEAMDKGFYAYYLPGVGTPFPEIKTYEYYSSGLTFATGGLARINWALIQIYNTLYHAVTGDKLTLSKIRTLQLNMAPSESYNPTHILCDQFRTIRNKIIKNKPATIDEFEISNSIINKFNIWREKILPEITIKQKNNNIKSYIPKRFITDDIESVIECQLILITAWRIGRYASPQDSAMNLTQQDFLKNAPQHADIDVQPYDPEFSKQASNAIAKEYWDVNKKTAEVREKREKEQKKQSDINNWQPSSKHIGPPYLMQLIQWDNFGKHL